MADYFVSLRVDNSEANASNRYNGSVYGAMWKAGAFWRGEEEIVVERLRNIIRTVDDVIQVDDYGTDDILGLRSNKNYRGDAYVKDDETIYVESGDERSEQDLKNRGYILQDASFLKDPVLSKLEVKPVLVNSFVPYPLSNMTVGEEDYHYAFMQAGTIDGKFMLKPSDRMLDAMQHAVLTVVSRAHFFEPNDVTRKHLIDMGVKTTKANINASRNLLYRNNLEDDLKYAIADDLGIRLKKGASKKDEETYNKILAGLANYAIEYGVYQGFFNKVAVSKAGKVPVNNYAVTEERFGTTLGLQAKKIREKKAKMALREAESPMYPWSEGGKILKQEIADLEKRYNEEYKAFEAKQNERIIAKYDTVREMLGASSEGLSILEVNETFVNAFRSSKGEISSNKALYAALNRFGGEENKAREPQFKMPDIKKIGMNRIKDTVLELSPKNEERLKRIATMPYSVDPISAEYINNLLLRDDSFKQKVLVKMGYVSEKSSEYINAPYSEKLSIEGRNATYNRSFDAYVDFCKNLKDNSEKGWESKFYLDHKLSRVGRFMINTEPVNPQRDPFHRFLISPHVVNRSSLDLNDKDQCLATIKAIGLGLGLTYDKTSTNKYIYEFNDNVRNLLLSSDEKEQIASGKVKADSIIKDLIIVDSQNGEASLNLKYIGSKEFSGVIDRMNEFVLSPLSDLEGIGISLRNIAHLDNLHKKVMEDYEKKGKPSAYYLGVSFLLEADGITNGFSLGNMMMPLAKNSEEQSIEEDNRCKGGYLRADTFGDYGQYLEAGGVDIYKSFSAAFKTEREKHPEWNEAFLRFFDDDPYSKSNRELFKSLGTVSFYGATTGIMNQYKDELGVLFERKVAKIAKDVKNIVERGADTDKLNKCIEECKTDSIAYLRMMGVGNTDRELLAERITERALGVSVFDESFTFSTVHNDRNEKVGSFYDLDELKKKNLFAKVGMDLDNICNHDVLADKDIAKWIKVAKGDAVDPDSGKSYSTLRQIIPAAFLAAAPERYNFVGQIIDLSNLQNALYTRARRALSNACENGDLLDEKTHKFKEGIFKGKDFKEAELALARNTICRLNYDGNVIPVAQKEREDLIGDDGKRVTTTQKFSGIKITYADSTRNIKRFVLGDPGASAFVHAMHSKDGLMIAEAAEKSGYNFLGVFDAIVTSQQYISKAANIYNDITMREVQQSNPVENMYDNFTDSMNYLKRANDDYNLDLGFEMGAWNAKQHRFGVSSEEIGRYYDMLTDKLAEGNSNTVESIDVNIGRKEHVSMCMLSADALNDTLEQMSKAKIAVYADRDKYIMDQMGGMGKLYALKDYEKMKEKAKTYMKAHNSAIESAKFVERVKARAEAREQSNTIFNMMEKMLKAKGKVLEIDESKDANKNKVVRKNSVKVSVLE